MSTRSTSIGTDRGELIAFLGALSLFLAAIEYLFPKPLPFFRLGLANLPILISLSVLKPREVLVLVAVKVVGQGLINGTLASYVFLFSLSGSLASALIMLGAHRLFRKWISLVGVSILGATASNAVQMTLSVMFIFGTNAWVIAPVFMSLGIASGIAVGLFADHFSRRSQWFAEVREYYA